MKRILSTLAVFSVMLSACNKLEVKPSQSLVVPQTLSDLQGLADNTIVMNMTHSLIGEVSSDNYYMPLASYNALAVPQYKAAYIWQKSPFAGVQTEPGWDSNYERVFYANVILDGLKELSPGVQSQVYNNVKGQALFIRANAFFAIAREFAKPYNQSSVNSDLGIVLRLSSDLNIHSVRSTIKAAYDQIISDLDQAVDLLPVTPLYKTRPAKQAATAVLARVYLTMENYEAAFRNADECLKINDALLDYNTVNGTVTYPFALLNNEVIFHCTLTNSSMLYPANAYIDPSLFATFEENDLRKSLFFLKNANGSVSFRGNYNGSRNPLFGGIAVDEMYLTRAECNTRLGRRAAALKDLNALLVTRYKAGTFTPRSASTDQEALDMILLERRKELIHRGIRWMDLRRLNAHPETATVLTRLVDGTTYTLPPNDPRYTFPIPDYIVAVNGIQQN